MANALRGAGVIRVSEVGEREAHRFVSPDVQTERIASLCSVEGIELLRVYPEMDVSGGAPLTRRPGLRQAVDAIERHEADVIVVAYFDRLVRSLAVQAEVVSRVEAAGGKVLAADVGHVTNGTASQWMSATMLGMVAEYMRRSTAERTGAAQRRAVEEFNRAPCPLIPGLRRREDGTIELHPQEAPIVRRAFEMRAEGASLREIHGFLNANGIRRRSLSARALMLTSPFAVGEIRWGDYRGTCPAIVDRDLFERVQGMTVSRGRLGKSQRLLARLGVLHCESCKGRMSVTSCRKGGAAPSGQTTYYYYRCSAIDCHDRSSINVGEIEEAVIAEVKRLSAGIRGRASAVSKARELRALADDAQTALERAIVNLSDVADEPAARQRLMELRAARDETRETAAQAERGVSVLEITAQRDWDDLSFQAQRELVKATIARVSVARGRGSGRIVIDPVALVE